MVEKKHWIKISEKIEKGECKNCNMYVEIIIVVEENKNSKKETLICKNCNVENLVILHKEV
jgi:RNase P subunit RPR2